MHIFLPESKYLLSQRQRKTKKWDISWLIKVSDDIVNLAYFRCTEIKCIFWILTNFRQLPVYFKLKSNGIINLAQHGSYFEEIIPS